MPKKSPTHSTKTGDRVVRETKRQKKGAMPIRSAPMDSGRLKEYWVVEHVQSHTKARNWDPFAICKVLGVNR